MAHGLAPADWPPLDEAEIAMLGARIPALQDAPAILWHSPRPFSTAALVQAGPDRYFIKRHARVVRDVPAVLEEHAFLAHLRRRGAPVPDVQRGVDGGSAVAIGNMAYEVHAAAPGVDAYRDAPSWTPVHSAAHARELGRALAQLHLAAAGFDAPARRVRPLLAGFEVIGSAEPDMALRRFIAARPALEDYLQMQGGTPGACAAILDAIAPFHVRLRPLLALLPAQWIHYDWHASNLFWTAPGPQAQICAMIDFGLCNRAAAVLDLATALERNAIAWLELDAGAPQDAAIGRVDLTLEILAGYCAVRPLSRAEATALPLLLAVGHVEFALSEVDYFHGVLGNAANARLAYPDFLLGHIAWFAGAQGRDLLAQITAWLDARPAA